MSNIISCFESVRFLSFSGSNISREVIAKIDTGAFSGVVHAENISVENGVLRFDLLGDEKLRLETNDFKTRYVRNTHGGRKVRYLVKFKILLEDCEYDIELGLDDRQKMKFEVLIGRSFLIRNNILVKPAISKDIDKEWVEMGEKNENSYSK